LSSAAGSGDSTPAESEHSGPLSGVDVLLARWLGEVLYLLEVEGFEYALTDAMEVGPTGLTARIRGWEDTEAVERDIKGVTYHRLRLAEADERLIAEVYFDL
jgi:SHS2 domain-containing protein